MDDVYGGCRRYDSEVDEMTECRLVRRDDFYDIFLDGKKCGSGTWAFVYTAFQFYNLEGFDVRIIQ